MSNHLRYEFEGIPGRIDLSRGPLFELYTTLPDEKEAPAPLTQADFPEPKIDTTDRTTTLTFSGKVGTLACTFQKKNAEVICSASLQTSGEIPVVALRFPVIEVNPAYPFDRLLMPHPMGDDMRFPTRLLRERYDGSLTYIYPASVGMQYMVLYNRARSVYLSAYSTGTESFGLTASADGDLLRLSLTWYPFLEQAGRWESPQCGMALLPGGWHKAADLYRSHMAGHFRPPELPKWMQEDFHGWVQFPMLIEGKEPACTFAELPEVYQRIARAGMNTLHVYGWSGTAFDTKYPEYVVNPVLGTPADVKRALDEIRRMGGHVILYTNGRLVDHDTDYYRSGGDRTVCRKADGTTYIETYGTSATFDVACPGAKGYRDKMVEAFKELVETYGAHAAQIDQVSCAPGYFCWDKSHDHDTPARNFLPGYDDMLARIHEVYRSADEDFFVWLEGCHERFARYCEVGQGHGEEQTWTAGESLPEQYHYTFPDHLCTGISDGIWRLCHTYGQGKPFDFHIHNLDDEEFATLLAQLLAVRRAEKAYFLKGRFLDDAPLEYAKNGCRMWAIERSDGQGLLVNIWSPGTSVGQAAEAKLAVPRPGAVRPVLPKDLSIREKGGWVTLSWTGPVATLVWGGG